MIFVTVGTHHEGFDRLIRRMDNIAPEIKEEIIMQIGFTKYKPKYVKYFDFDKELDKYYEEARLIITQSATSLIEFALKYHKPVITVPRQKKFKEHINDHQVEFAEFFSARTRIKCILNIKELTPNLLKNYKNLAKLDETKLKNLQKFFVKLIHDI